MPIIQHNARLNAVLVDLGRSLLQYVGESCPWVGQQLSAEKTFRQLVARQQNDGRRIVELLQERGHPIDFGMYPSQYSDLHFVGLQFMLKQLVVSQTALVAEVDEAAHVTVDDPAATQLLGEITNSQRTLLDQLKSLQSSASAPQPVG